MCVYLTRIAYACICMYAHHGIYIVIGQFGLRGQKSARHLALIGMIHTTTSTHTQAHYCLAWVGDKFALVAYPVHIYPAKCICINLD